MTDERVGPGTISLQQAELNRLIEKASHIQMTEEQKREQRLSFAYGNTHLSNSKITREMIEEADQRLETSAYIPPKTHVDSLYEQIAALTKTIEVLSGKNVRQEAHIQELLVANNAYRQLAAEAEAHLREVLAPLSDVG